MLGALALLNGFLFLFSPDLLPRDPFSNATIVINAAANIFLGIAFVIAGVAMLLKLRWVTTVGYLLSLAWILATVLSFLVLLALFPGAGSGPEFMGGMFILLRALVPTAIVGAYLASPRSHATLHQPENRSPLSERTNQVLRFAALGLAGGAIVLLVGSLVLVANDRAKVRAKLSLEQRAKEAAAREAEQQAEAKLRGALAEGIRAQKEGRLAQAIKKFREVSDSGSELAAVAKPQLAAAESRLLSKTARNIALELKSGNYSRALKEMIQLEQVSPDMPTDKLGKAISDAAEDHRALLSSRGKFIEATHFMAKLLSVSKDHGNLIGSSVDRQVAEIQSETKRLTKNKEYGSALNLLSLAQKELGVDLQDEINQTKWAIELPKKYHKARRALRTGNLDIAYAELLSIWGRSPGYKDIKLLMRKAQVDYARATPRLTSPQEGKVVRPGETVELRVAAPFRSGDLNALVSRLPADKGFFGAWANWQNCGNVNASERKRNLWTLKAPDFCGNVGKQVQPWLIRIEHYPSHLQPRGLLDGIDALQTKRFVSNTVRLRLDTR